MLEILSSRVLHTGILEIQEIYIDNELRHSSWVWRQPATLDLTILLLFPLTVRLNISVPLRRVRVTADGQWVRA